MENKFKQLRLNAGMTLQEASNLADYSIATISALEVDNRGSERLKQKLLEVYDKKRADAPAVLKEDSPIYGIGTKKDLAKLREQVQKLAETFQKQITEIHEMLNELEK